jgi:membrane associated rhomboid family serine protease
MAFFQDDRRAREPMFNLPASVLVLVGILAAAHAARVFAPPPLADRILNDYALDPAAYTDPTATLFDQLVPPFSYMLLHANWLHLGFNSVWLLAFGAPLARRFGWFGFYVLFILSGAAGAFCFVVVNWGQNIGAVGASGAIAGVMAAAFRMLYLGAPHDAKTPLAPLLSRPVLQFSAIWLIVNVISAFTGIGTLGTEHTIAWEAHMGGFLAGLLLAGPFDGIFGARAIVRRHGA